MRSTIILLLALLCPFALAQFQFFEQMFQGGGQQQQQQQRPSNVPSDSNWYQDTYEQATCDNYLCPGTLACVHFPHHCPCPWPAVEEKVEFGEGSALCISKGGYKAGEATRKIELARKGLI